MGLCQCNVTGHGTDSEMFATRRHVNSSCERMHTVHATRDGSHYLLPALPETWIQKYSCEIKTQVTAEEFAEKLDRQASKSKAKTGEVMINVDVIETILLEACLIQLVCQMARTLLVAELWCEFQASAVLS